jgi:hypothetical protein
VSSGINVDIDSLRALFTIFPGGLSFLSAGVVGRALFVVGAVPDLKSNAVPGVLAADPKDAKAPEPSPNADEPPVVGEARPPGVSGETPLKGFRPPCDESPPKRFAEGKVRCGCSDFSLCCSECDMDKESLLELQLCQLGKACGEQDGGILGTAGPEVLPVVHWRSELVIQQGREAKYSAWSLVG